MIVRVAFWSREDAIEFLTWADANLTRFRLKGNGRWLKPQEIGKRVRIDELTENAPWAWHFSDFADPLEGAKMALLWGQTC